MAACKTKLCQQLSWFFQTCFFWESGDPQDVVLFQLPKHCILWNSKTSKIWNYNLSTHFVSKSVLKMTKGLPICTALEKKQIVWRNTWVSFKQTVFHYQALCFKQWICNRSPVQCQQIWNKTRNYDWKKDLQYFGKTKFKPNSNLIKSDQKSVLIRFDQVLFFCVFLDS